MMVPPYQATQMYIIEDYSLNIHCRMNPGITQNRITIKHLPICKGSFTARFLKRCSPRWNSSALPLARQEYRRMSSSLSGKLQNAIRSCSCSGTGGQTCSTSSNGICDATHRAVSSPSDGTWIPPSATNNPCHTIRAYCIPVKFNTFRTVILE